MFEFARRFLNRSHAAREIPDSLWRQTLARCGFLATLPPRERHRLRHLVSSFLHKKTFEGAAGQLIDDALRVMIASQACLLILNLGLDYYAGWSSIIVYPGEFRVQREYRDSVGVVHEGSEILSGESWQRGPVVLSWRAAASPDATGHNVVLHEFAHKIDMLNGLANGFPPLHAGMDANQWSADLAAAYANLQQVLASGDASRIDPYAAKNAGEFFAVLSEAFFISPQTVLEDYPSVYTQLARFYRQDPLTRQ